MPQHPHSARSPRIPSVAALAIPLLALAVGILWPGAAVSAAAQTVEGSFERTLPVTGPVELDVQTGSGAIAVRAGEAGRVHLVGRIRARGGWRGGPDAAEKVRRLEADPPVRQNGNAIHIGRIEDRDLRENVSISYEVVVPPDTRLRSRTGSGSQTVEGIGGPIEATTGSGSIRVRDAGAAVAVSSGSGSLDIESARGAVRAKTGSGSIRVEQTGAGDVELSSGSGTVRAAGVRGALRAHSSSGGIRAAGVPTGDWRLTASSGSIVVELPEDAGFELDARASSGRVTTNHPVTVMGSIGQRALRGTVRGGGPRVEIRTSSGSIRVD